MLDTAFDIRIRVAESAQSGEGASSIAKDRIDRDAVTSRNCIYMTNYDISYIMIYHDIS